MSQPTLSGTCRAFTLLVSTLAIAACGGGGGGGGESCNPQSFVALNYVDARFGERQTVFSSAGEYFASLESVQYNPKYGELCGASKTFRVISGSLPAGVTLDRSTGVIAGSPTVSGIFTPTIGLAVSGYGGEATSRMNFTVDDFSASWTGNTAVAVNSGVNLTPVLNDGQISDITGVGINSNARRGSLIPAGATTTYTILSGSLPPGVTLNPTTGVISGTATATGSFFATIRLVASKDGASQAARPDPTVSIGVH